MDAFVPSPFGTGPWANNAPQWWHSLYSFVVPWKGGWSIVYPSGSVANFDPCTVGPSGCYPRVSSDSLEVTHKLFVAPADGGQVFTLFTGETRHVYESRWDSADGGTQRLFLSRVESADYASTVPTLTLNYGLPDAGSCPGSVNGVPYIANVLTADGTRYEFSYARIPVSRGSKISGYECVLSQISVDGGVALARYTYDGGAGLIMGVEYPQRPILGGATRQETYLYNADGTSLAVYENGWQRLALTAPSNGVVTTQSSLVDGVNFRTEWTRDSVSSSASCNSGYSSCSNATQSVVSQFVTSGLGTGGDAGLAGFLVVTEGSPSYTGQRVSRQTRADGGDVESWTWTAVGGHLANTSYSNPNGNFVVTNVVAATGLPGTFSTPYEVSAVKFGATDSSGANALESKSYTYIYGDGGSPRGYRQLVSTATTTSSLDAGVNSVITYNYDNGTERLVSVIRSGYTRTYAGRFNWPLTQRYIATFYESSDPLGRVTAVRGPCFVSSTTATQCDPGQIPYSSYEYYGSNAGANSNKLYRVMRYANASSNGTTITLNSAGLVTTYADYDSWGNPRQVTDENSVTTVYSYQESRVRSRKTGTAGTWLYTYDGDKLTSIQWPSGGFEVFCYRASPVGSCLSTYPPTKVLAWKALAASASGSAYKEAVRYTYGGDQRLVLEEHLDASGTVRRTVSREADRDGNPAYEANGSMTPTRRLYDGVGNLVGLSMPFNQAAAFCGASASPGAPTDARCALLTYDRADRLTSLDEAGATAGGARTARTLFTYDSQGNISGIKMGCAPGASWASCSAKPAMYETDDFGNLVSFALPNNFGLLADAGGTNVNDPSPSYIEYNAMGLPVRRQTIGMDNYAGVNYERSLKWTYDSLGRRVLYQSVYPDGGVETLSTNTWDANPLPTGCATFWGNYFAGFQINKTGRLASTTDPIWETHFGYDQEGRLTQELRVLRTGTPACTEWVKDFSATTYAYNSNGDLIQDSRAPLGRVVYYNYSSAGLDRRINSIDVNVFSGWGWSATRMISNAAWEPYGGLRSYTMVGPFSGGVAGAVEYVPGSQSGSVTCSTTPSANDGSGRLGAILVTADGGTNLMKRLYSWTNDQLTSVNTCYLDAGTAIAETFTYDARNQLATAAQPNFASAGGAYSYRGYSYDLRGNQLSTIWDSSDAGLIYTLGTYPAAPDQLYSVKHPTYEYASFDYTGDGQMGRKFGPYDSSGEKNTVWTYDWGESTSIYGTPAGFGGESVYRTMGFGKPNGTLLYTSYFYDEGRRRVAKESNGTVGKEYYHWSPARELLDDVGYLEPCVKNGATRCRGSDDYVWLGGRPVLQLRSSAIDTTGAEQYYPAADGTGICRRWGEDVSCDAYFIVTDHVGRPVLMLNHAMQVSGTGEYEPFGALNRVHYLAESSHPYPLFENRVFNNVGRPRVAGLNVAVRAHLPMLDIEGTRSGVALENVDGGSLVGTTTLNGLQNTDTWTPWVVQASDGALPRLHFWANTPPTVSPRGILMTEFEYRRYQTTYPFFTALRGAGQYYDRESDMFENWNRYYDASGGRYSATEPLLQSPAYVRRMAKSGMSVPTYAYAANNPTLISDPDGNHPVLIALGVGGAIILYESWALNRAQKLGRTESDRMFPGLQQGPRDAMRHCLASCEAARWGGVLPAAVAGYINELPFSRNSQAERAMDLHNNRCGRSYSSDIDGCVESCRAGLTSGDLFTDVREASYP